MNNSFCIAAVRTIYFAWKPTSGGIPTEEKRKTVRLQLNKRSWIANPRKSEMYKRLSFPFRREYIYTKRKAPDTRTYNTKYAYIDRRESSVSQVVLISK